MKELLNFNNGLGSWRVSKDNNIILPTRQWNLVINHEMEINQLEINQLTVPDEWDTEEFANNSKNISGSWSGLNMLVVVNPMRLDI